jgi:type I restriction enzyme, S subunit
MREDWTTAKLGDVADVQWGDTSTTKASYVEAGYLAYSATGPDGFLDHFDHEGQGIVLSAIGAQCGKTWFANGKWSCIKNTIVLKGHDGEVVTRFLFYATSVPDFWPKRGAAQPFISQGDARKIELAIPPLSTQRRISSILGAYDDLIEVNKQRIALLKETAQRLFDEWFVRFRFPGYEGCTLIELPNGPLPSGWEWRSLEEVCMRPDGIQTGPFGTQLHQADYIEDGVPVVMPKNLVSLRVVEGCVDQASDPADCHGQPPGAPTPTTSGWSLLIWTL